MSPSKTPVKTHFVIDRDARVSLRGDGLDPNLLYPRLEEEEERPPLFSQFSQ
jgi:hypothetical protein